MGAFLCSPLQSGWLGPRKIKAHGMARSHEAEFLDAEIAAVHRDWGFHYRPRFSYQPTRSSSEKRPCMSASGQKRTARGVLAKSAFPSVSDIAVGGLHVGFVP